MTKKFSSNKYVDVYIAFSSLDFIEFQFQFSDFLQRKVLIIIDCVFKFAAFFVWKSEVTKL